MKKRYLGIFTALMITSCGTPKEASVDEILASNNVEQMQAEKAKIEGKLQEFSVDLKKLNEQIALLSEDKNIPLITTLTDKRRGVYTSYRIARKCTNQAKRFGVPRNAWNLLRKVCVRRTTSCKRASFSEY